MYEDNFISTAHPCGDFGEARGVLERLAKLEARAEANGGLLSRRERLALEALEAHLECFDLSEDEQERLAGYAWELGVAQ